MQKSAVISPDGKYRYTLTRIWDSSLPIIVFIMLNPSTADGQVDDATIRRLISFSRLWGYGGFVVVNLYGFRATNPKNMFRDADPIGPENDKYIAFYVIQTPTVVVAWGDNATTERAQEIINLIKVERARDGRYESIIYCLGKTKSGNPRHPVRLAGNTPLEVFV